MDFLTQRLTTSTTEILILALIFLSCFALVFIWGRGRAIALTLSFYPAAFFYSLFPLSDKLLILKGNEWQIFSNKFVLFLAFMAITFFILNFITTKGWVKSSRRQPFKNSILALGLSTLILLTIFQIIPLKEITDYLPKTGQIFADTRLFFWLLIVPLALILLFVRR